MVDENTQAEDNAAQVTEDEYQTLPELLQYLEEAEVAVQDEDSIEEARTKVYELADRYNALVYRAGQTITELKTAQDAKPDEPQVATEADVEALIASRVAEQVDARSAELADQYREMEAQLQNTFAERERATVEEYQARIVQLEEAVAEAVPAEEPVSAAQDRLNRILEETRDQASGYLTALVERSTAVVAEAEAEAEEIRARAIADAERVTSEARDEANQAIEYRNQAIKNSKDILNRLNGLFAHQQNEFSRQEESLTEVPLLQLEAAVAEAEEDAAEDAVATEAWEDDAAADSNQEEASDESNSDDDEESTSDESETADEQAEHDENDESHEEERPQS